MVTVAIDGMGGDRAPRIVIEGMMRASLRYPHARFLLFGDEKKIATIMQLKQFKALPAKTKIIHTNEEVAMDEIPSVAIRRGGKTSMALALKAVKAGEADCMISAGNTGALMGMAKIFIRTVEGIERPAIGTFMPSMSGEVLMLDLGANLEASAKQLVQFAVMGKFFSNAAIDLSNPKIGLLNIGTEELKGRDEIKEAGAKLESLKAKLNYIGFVEADQIFKGNVDIIVTDGFSGNIALKAVEGVAAFLTTGLKRVYRSGVLARIGFLFAAIPMRHFYHRIDPRVYNGAALLGLNAVVIKSHGGTDGVGFSHALSIAISTVENKFTEKMNEQLPDFLENS